MQRRCLTAYLGNLPHGLASYPDCAIKASIYRGYLGRLELSEADIAGVPQELCALVHHPVPVSTWIPATHSLALTMVYRDVLEHRGKDFATFIGVSSAKMFQTRMYSVLMVVMRPEYLIRAAGIRWSKFNRGTHMRVLQSAKTSVRLRFEFPKNLYGPDHYDGLEAACRSALEVSGAEAVACTRTPQTQTGLDLDFDWH